VDWAGTVLVCTGMDDRIGDDSLAGMVLRLGKHSAQSWTRHSHLLCDGLEEGQRPPARFFADALRVLADRDP
jgi:hypothetical protein